MTLQDALKVLAVNEPADLSSVKKSYRKLVRILHPDVLDAGTSIAVSETASGFSDAGSSDALRYPYTITEVNEAYEYIMKMDPAEFERMTVHLFRETGKRRNNTGMTSDTASGKETASGRAGKRDNKNIWRAPINHNAFRARSIFNYAEGPGGERIGIFTAATGKYLWTPDEEFTLFLKSLYELSGDILTEYNLDPDHESTIRAELCFLLAQQYTDSTEMLKRTARIHQPNKTAKDHHTTTAADQKTTETDTSEGNTNAASDTIYLLSGMLEFTERKRAFPEGTALYPMAVRNHKLYLQNKQGIEAGYLSFPDDKLYYILIPLFEQKRVRIKVQVGKEVFRGTKKSQKLLVGIKLIEGDFSSVPDDLNARIERLLMKNRKNRYDYEMQ